MLMYIIHARRNTFGDKKKLIGKAREREKAF